MKLLTITIPCYNSADYMRKSIESLLPGGNVIEILIVDDCSTDTTYEIAVQYQEQYPKIVRALHREKNGGHGAAVMTGLHHAQGRYFKVVDSDDWVNDTAYKRILSLLTTFGNSDTEIDMLLSNFVYEKQGAKNKKIMKYTNILPENKIFSWNDCGHFRTGKYILMHSITYRTQLLIDCNLQLPEHTFYVDNIFAFYPLPYVKKMYYLNTDFYRYFIGRTDQSVNESVMIKRIDQQLKVNRIMIDEYENAAGILKRNRNLDKYMYKYLEIITSISTIMLLLSGTKTDLEKKQQLWDYIKEKNIRTWRKMRSRFMGFVMNIPGKIGANLSVMIYTVLQKKFGFN